MNDVLVPGRCQTRGRLPRLRRLLWNAAGSCSLAGLYAGSICRTWLRFVRLDMPLPKLPAAFEGAKLVHISDLHCSPIVLGRYLQSCIEHINEENPDFVAITGDFITGGTYYARRVSQLLSGLQAGVARVACLGNHDFGIYHPRGHGHMRQLSGYLSRRLFEAGVHVLRNQHAIFRRGGSAIQFVGTDDLWSDSYDPHGAFAEAHDDLPTIAITHNPDAARQLVGLGAHWVLAGHTHGSDMWQRGPMVNSVFPMTHKDLNAGHFVLGEAQLYVNRGLSYARRTHLNRRPEVTVFTLRRA